MDQVWTCDQRSSGLGVRGECVDQRSYGDLVGVLFSDLLDLFAAISWGEEEEKVFQLESRLKQQIQNKLEQEEP